MTTETKKPESEGNLYKNPNEVLKETADAAKKIAENIPILEKAIKNHDAGRVGFNPTDRPRTLDPDARSNQEAIKKIVDTANEAKRVLDTKVKTKPLPLPDRDPTSNLETDSLLSMGWSVSLGVVRGTKAFEEVLAGNVGMPVFVGEGEEAFRDPSGSSGEDEDYWQEVDGKD